MMILIVDSNQPVKELVASNLLSAGCEVLAVSSAERALEVLVGFKSFDAIVSGFTLSGMDGLQFLHEVKADPELASINFVVFSAGLSEEDQVHLRENNAKLVAKPNWAALREALGLPK